MSACVWSISCDFFVLRHEFARLRVKVARKRYLGSGIIGQHPFAFLSICSNILIDKKHSYRHALRTNGTTYPHSPPLFCLSQASNAAAAHPISRIPSLEKQPGDVTLRAHAHTHTFRECEREFPNVLEGGIMHLKKLQRKRRMRGKVTVKSSPCKSILLFWHKKYKVENPSHFYV